MEKRAVIIFFISLALFLGVYLGADKFPGSLKITDSDIKGDELGKNNVIEQNIPDEFLLVLSGIDKEVSTTDHQGPDTIMACKVSSDSDNADILSVPRDAQIRLNGNIHEVNVAHAYEGARGPLKALRNLLGINLDYYVEVDFDSAEHIVDAMGGVGADSPAEIVVELRHIRTPRGESKLNGDEALQYVRACHPLGGSNEVRIESQHYFIKTLSDQLLSPANITKMPETIEIFKRGVKTNTPLGDMIFYLMKFPNLSSSKIHSYILSGEYKNDGTSWYTVDEEQLPETVDRLFAEYKLDNQTTNREDNEDNENEEES